jgi:hypothetical protein
MDRNKSVRTRSIDNPAVRSPDKQLLKGVERRSAVATGVGFNDQPADKTTHARNEDANVFLILPSALIDSANVVEFGFQTSDGIEDAEPDARKLNHHGAFLDLICPQPGHHLRVIHG